MADRAGGISRRALLRAALGAAGVAALAACGGAATTPVAGTALPAGGGGSNATATATTAARATTTTASATAAANTTTGAAPATAAGSPVAVDGKIPGGAPGVPDAYVKLPPAFKSVAAVPGKGGKVTTFQIAYNPPVPPRGENCYWQELEKRLGVTFEPTLQPADGYPEKLAVLTASGDMPDLVFIVPEQAPGQYSLVKQGAYADLTPYLTGDALKDFPNLASYPEYLWKNVAVNGKIYGVPRPQLRTGAGMSWRKDWAEKFGNPQPKNADEFYQLMVAFTKQDPDGNGKEDTYGLGSITQFVYNLPFFQNMFRVPNVWRKNPDGTLTHAIETEGFRATLAYMRKLFEAGIFHPDTGTMNRTQRKDFINGGKVGGVMDAISNFAGAGGFRDEARKITPTANVTGLVPPGHDGGKATTDNTNGFFGFAAMPAKIGRDRERVKELLRVVDYFAAPFGSEESAFLGNGIEGVHHEIKPDGTRVRNDLGRAEIGDLNSLGGNLPAYYYTIPGDAREVQSVVREILALGQDNPALGLYSPTDASRAGELNQLRIDRVAAIVSGRAPLGALDQYVRDWKARGGDQIRKEYEDALKA